MNTLSASIRVSLVILAVSTAGLSFAGAQGVACAGAFAAATATAAVYQTSPLAAGDKLATTVDDIATQWGDNNISTGTTVALGLQLDRVPGTVGEMKALARQLFVQVLKQKAASDLPADAKLTIASSRYSQIVLDKTVEALMTSNDYAPENVESQTELKDQTTQLLTALGSPASLDTFSVTVKLQDEASGEDRAVELDGFVNPSTRQAVLIFTIEGSM